MLHTQDFHQIPLAAIPKDHNFTEIMQLKHN